MVFVQTFVGNCNFFPFRTQSSSISKVVESSDLSNQSDDENGESDDGELDNAIRRWIKKKTKCHLFIKIVKCAVYIGVTTDSKGVFRTHLNILDGALHKNNLRI